MGNRSTHSPSGNRQMRRVLNQAANAAVKRKGSIFELLYRRLISRLGNNKTICVVANRLCHLIWMILHNGVHYEERGPEVSEQTKQPRDKNDPEPRLMGYRVEPLESVL